MTGFDPTKLLPPEVVTNVYNDALSPAVKQFGQFGEDVLKVARLVLFPIQYAATLQDRLAKHLKTSIEQVPPARRVVPPEPLAAPIVEQLKYHDDASEIGRLFINLLSRAMDKERSGEAHPAFVQIIGQLAPDEAVLIGQIAQSFSASYLRPPRKGSEVFLASERASLIAQSGLPKGPAEMLRSLSVKPEEISQPELLYTYIEHLVSLGLVGYAERPWGSDYGSGKPAAFDYWFIELTGMGRLFYTACVKAPS
ncbi:Abi-alpha family protein [Herbaspirillum huttiense]|jgi:hypothetical protein|uniref:Abi-alpha family protein n=1 Tax=Herbaspirillum huttiense TaxID=863372 RepID=UPI003819628B